MDPKKIIGAVLGAGAIIGSFLLGDLRDAGKCLVRVSVKNGYKHYYYEKSKVFIKSGEGMVKVVSKTSRKPAKPDSGNIITLNPDGTTTTTKIKSKDIPDSICVKAEKEK